MKVLLVEDNYDKFPLINKALSGFKNVTFTKVVSSSDAIRELSHTLFDVMIIDIQIPDINGGDINTAGGIELVQNVENLIDAKISRYIMGLTANTSDVDLHLDIFKKYGWPLFDLKRDASEWKELLITKANSI